MKVVAELARRKYLYPRTCIFRRWSHFGTRYLWNSLLKQKGQLSYNTKNTPYLPSFLLRQGLTLCILYPQPADLPLLLAFVEVMIDLVSSGFALATAAIAHMQVRPHHMLDPLMESCNIHQVSREGHGCI